MIPPFAGKSYYQSDREADGQKLLIAIPCHLGSMEQTVWALLDTAAEWCVFSGSLVELLGDEADFLDLPATMHTRFGTILGEFARLTITFPAVEGESLSVGRHVLRLRVLAGPQRDRLERLPRSDTTRVGSRRRVILLRSAPTPSLKE